MPTKVTLSQTGDSHAIGAARLRLKLAAIAYVNARHGVDADVGMSRAGLQLLCSAAVEYYEALIGADPRDRPVDASLRLNGGT